MFSTSVFFFFRPKLKVDRSIFFGVSVAEFTDVQLILSTCDVTNCGVRVKKSKVGRDQSCQVFNERSWTGDEDVDFCDDANDARVDR